MEPSVVVESGVGGKSGVFGTVPCFRVPPAYPCLLLGGYSQVSMAIIINTTFELDPFYIQPYYDFTISKYMAEMA